MPYVENTLYSTNKYSCVRRVHTLYISYFIKHNGDDEPHETLGYLKTLYNLQWLFSIELDFVIPVSVLEDGGKNLPQYS